MEDVLVPILVPFMVCVVLPVSIVWIIFRCISNADNKRAEVLVKALETNNGIDADRLVDAFSKSKKENKTPREILNGRLLRGCIFTLCGVVLIAFYYINSWGYEEFHNFLLILGGISAAVGISFLTVFFATRKQVKD